MNPLGVKVELDNISLARLVLISDTNILYGEENSLQKRRLLKIDIYNLLRKLILKTLIFPLTVTSSVTSLTSIQVSESEFMASETKNIFYFNQAIPL
jgi:hypothetical protein